MPIAGDEHAGGESVLAERRAETWLCEYSKLTGSEPDSRTLFLLVASLAFLAASLALEAISDFQ